MNWSNTPPWTSQVSVKNRYDALDCVCESLGNVIYMLTGFDSSPRFWAKLVQSQHGSNTTKVLAVVKKYGILPYELWPSPDDFDEASYYADIPQEIMEQAIPIDIKTVPFDLNVSPGWTAIQWGFDSPGVISVKHMVAQLNNTQYFDSEWGAPIKPLNYEGAHIIYQTSLKVKIMISCKTVKYIDNKTLGMMIDTPNGTQIIKATGEEQWRSWNKPDSYGKPTVNPDGTTNWNVEIQLNI